MGANVEKVITAFEHTIIDRHKEDYEGQEKLLTGYKKLLEEQIHVINARLNMTKRLKLIKTNLNMEHGLFRY